MMQGYTSVLALSTRAAASASAARRLSASSGGSTGRLTSAMHSGSDIQTGLYGGASSAQLFCVGSPVIWITSPGRRHMFRLRTVQYTMQTDER